MRREPITQLTAKICIGETSARCVYQAITNTAKVVELTRGQYDYFHFILQSGGRPMITVVQ